MDRYARNEIISEEEQSKLGTAKVCVLGCGGLGGYIIEMLARIGIGYLTVVDGDVFSESNLNRQLLSMERNLGKSKAIIASERVQDVNSDVQVNCIHNFVNENNVKEIIAGHDIIVDALDSNDARVMVLKACAELGLPYVYGAIAGWYGQVSTVFPEDTLIREYLSQIENRGVETDIGNPSFTPACIASYQASETIKILLKRGSLLREQILFVDLLNDETELIMEGGP